MAEKSSISGEKCAHFRQFCEKAEKASFEEHPRSVLLVHIKARQVVEPVGGVRDLRLRRGRDGEDPADELVRPCVRRAVGISEVDRRVPKLGGESVGARLQIGGNARGVIIPTLPPPSAGRRRCRRSCSVRGARGCGNRSRRDRTPPARGIGPMSATSQRRRGCS